MNSPSRNSGAAPLLRLQGIRKAFPGVQAVGDGSFDLYPGEIHALVGENGAGKSTLIKILTGVFPADTGHILLDQTPVRFDSPLAAQQSGIAPIYQEYTLIPQLSASANIFLGREKTRRGFVDVRREEQHAKELFSRLGVTVDPQELVAHLNVAEQQLVEIARALATDARIIVMDEPTAALTPREVARLFTVLRDLAARGIGIIFISHRLDEVFDIAGRVTVMRDGLTVGTWPTADLDREQLIEKMVGRALQQEYPERQSNPGEVCFRVTGLSGGRLHDISLTVRRGEVLGMAGLMGAGRTDVARLVFGADRKTAGTMELDGERITVQAPRDAIRQGICLLTEDRKAQGLILKASARDNFALPNLPRWSHFGWIDQTAENGRFRHHVEALNIRLASPEQSAETLSGGNQQKLLVARWLESQSRVIIFDEPTRGIDVGAKYDMYCLIGELARQGKAVIVISSELPELLGICDRIVVMREGKITGQIDNTPGLTQEDIMALAV